MKLTVKQLKQLIRECACEELEAVQECGGEEPSTTMNVVSEPEIKSSLFPTLKKAGEATMGAEVVAPDMARPEEIIISLPSPAPALDAGGAEGQEVVDLNNLVDKAAGGLPPPHKEEWIQEQLTAATALMDSVQKYLDEKKNKVGGK